jgi:hypothetical protein
MSRFFAYSRDGFTFHATAEEAKAQAETLLAHERGFAIIEGEWSEDANSIMWGEIRGHVDEEYTESDSGEESLEMSIKDMPAWASTSTRKQVKK